MSERVATAAWVYLRPCNRQDPLTGVRGWKPSSAVLEGVLHGVLPSSRCAASGCAAKAFSLFLRASVIGLVARVLLTSFLISFAFFPRGLSGRDHRTTSPSTSSRTVCATSRTSPPVPPRFGPAGRGRLTPCFCPFLRALTGSHTTEMSLQKCKSKYGTTRDWPSLARGRKTNVAGIASAICNIT